MAVGSAFALHQVVIASNVGVATEWYGGFYTNPDGPHTLVWGGAGGPPLTGLVIPTVMQDTDGYSGVPGDWQSIGTIDHVTIPAGLGGMYTVIVEGMTAGTAWWPAPGGVTEGHPPSPHAVPYVFGGASDGGASPGDGFPTSPWRATYDIRANGGVVATYDITGPAGYTQSTPVSMNVPGVALHAGDVITATVTWHESWGVSNFKNAIGMAEPATHFAVFVLTRTGGVIRMRGSGSVAAGV